MEIKDTFQWTRLQIVYHWRDLSSDTPKRCLFCILKYSVAITGGICSLTQTLKMFVCVCVCVCVSPSPHPTPTPRILSFSHVLSPPFLGFTPAPWHSEEKCLPLSHCWGSHAVAQHIKTRGLHYSMHTTAYHCCCLMYGKLRVLMTLCVPKCPTLRSSGRLSSPSQRRFVCTVDELPLPGFEFSHFQSPKCSLVSFLDRIHQPWTHLRLFHSPGWTAFP